ncbi:CopD family protein [Acidithiobacillus ferriphilus]|uniref:CopD family protein n=1 Tax=Acidithiobacillus ferriphilus TaxID=1689834 RepID=UPI001C071886|nr:CopD family protein [Acidithiobacillus ferriphilus]MEB8535066.1 CopD family protein [Acidithiobacillus ferriphilus]
MPVNLLWIEQFVHIVAVVIWIGGLFFATVVLAPVLQAEIAQVGTRIPLLHAILRRFFLWVFISGAVLLSSGYTMVPLFYGGFATLSAPVSIMMLLGTVMVMLSLHVYFAPLKRLRRAVRDQDWKAGARALGQVRLISGVNLLLSLVVILMGVWGMVGTPW